MECQDTLDFLNQWSTDLNIKGFQNVRILENPVPHVEALRRDGKRFFGYAAMDMLGLNERLRLQLRGKVQSDFVVFLVVGCDLMEEAERRLKKWDLQGKINLEGVF